MADTVENEVSDTENVIEDRSMPEEPDSSELLTDSITTAYQL